MMDLIRMELPDLSGIFEILLLAVLFYYIILFFRGTRGAQVLSGFVVSLLLLLLLTQFLHLNALNWLLKKMSGYLALAIVIIFQPEVRRALAELGKQPVFSGTKSERARVDDIVQAVMMLAERKIGALIAIEMEIGTRALQESGVRMDSRLTPELLATIFYPHTPLHDGGVIIQGNRIVAAGCVFPLSQQQEINRALGTRHRAAVGMTEETDAVVLVVSEETGTISVALGGKLTRGWDADRLKRLLSRMLVRGKRHKSTIKRVKEQLDISPRVLDVADIHVNGGTSDGV